MQNLRELAEAIDLGDTTRAAMVLDAMARDEELAGEPWDATHAIDLGRTDAANKRRRASVEPLRAAA